MRECALRSTGRNRGKQRKRGGHGQRRTNKKRFDTRSTPGEVLKAGAKRGERNHTKTSLDESRIEQNKNVGKTKSKGCGRIGGWA